MLQENLFFQLFWFWLVQVRFLKEINSGWRLFFGSDRIEIVKN